MVPRVGPNTPQVRPCPCESAGGGAKRAPRRCWMVASAVMLGILPLGLLNRWKRNQGKRRRLQVPVCTASEGLPFQWLWSHDCGCCEELRNQGDAEVGEGETNIWFPSTQNGPRTTFCYYRLFLKKQTKWSIGIISLTTCSKVRSPVCLYLSSRLFFFFKHLQYEYPGQGTVFACS